MTSMRGRAVVLAGVMAMAGAYSSPPVASGRARSARPAYEWAVEAQLVVVGRVERVGRWTADLSVTSTLAGDAAPARIEFEPIGHPECRGKGDADVAVGDEVALFLVRDEERSAWTVLDDGYAKLAIGDGGRGLWSTTLEHARELVEIGRAHDVAARDRAMIRMARSESRLLRCNAAAYIQHALGVGVVIDPVSTCGTGRVARDAEHLDGVRRLAEELATLLEPDVDAAVRRAALRVLADAECAPTTAFHAVSEIVAARSEPSLLDNVRAGEILARYDDPRALATLLRAARDEPSLLACVGSSPVPMAGTALLAEFHSGDATRRNCALRGIARRLARSRDAALEEALLRELRDPRATNLIGSVASALRVARPAEAPGLVLDLLARPNVPREVEDEAARALQNLLYEAPAADGVRDAIVRRQNVLIARLDARKTTSVHAIRLLHDLGTDEATAALKRAAASYPDFALRAEAAERRQFPCGR